MDDDGPPWSIGQVVARSGTPATTLRYYEQRGLIDPPPRVGGRRRYGPEVLMRLTLIEFCRIAGLSLDEIATVIADPAPARPATQAIAAERIDAIDRQIGELELARDLLRAAGHCRCVELEACSCGALAPLVGRLREARGGRSAGPDPPPN